jgi:predicted ATP-grasp superfamily ATP-dependent carboligase
VRNTLQIQNITTPVVVVNCKLGALAIMRSLGEQGISIYGVDADPHAPGLLSRYCKKRFLYGLDERRPEQFVEQLLRVGEEIGRQSILIPTSDETAVFVTEYAEALSRWFMFPNNSPAVLRELISKKGMYELVGRHGVPTPFTLFPESLADVESSLNKVKFPLMLKGIYGNRLQARNKKKMVTVHSPNELIEQYKEMEEPGFPNLMLQEYIPGGDDQIFMFNGYFDQTSDCRIGLTGYKIRQFPVHVGCTSLGECRWNETVAKLTTQFMKAIGYRGVLDIGYRFDARDGQYKVLDINPRVGQAFRLFVAEGDMDVVKALYLDLTGQPIPMIIPREGRRWMIEDFDLISSNDYYQEGTLSFPDWIRSLKGVEEAAWFNKKDLRPFFVMAGGLLKQMRSWSGKAIARKAS